MTCQGIARHRIAQRFVCLLRVMSWQRVLRVAQHPNKQAECLSMPQVGSSQNTSDREGIGLALASRPRPPRLQLHPRRAHPTAEGSYETCTFTLTVHSATTTKTTTTSHENARRRPRIISRYRQGICAYILSLSWRVCMSRAGTHAINRRLGRQAGKQIMRSR